MRVLVAVILLLALVGCTSAPKPPTQQPMAAQLYCAETPCILPGRPAPVSNDDWTVALDETEAALKVCAVKLLKCLGRQREGVAPSNGTQILPIQRNSAVGIAPDSGFAPSENQ